ncbi:MAG: TetR/AcrR family transcriptional regulator [Sphingomonadales bacterium]
MPLDIDQEQRREDVARAAAKLVAERGMGAITFRNLAAELGCSTTAISHYFANRAEILAETYRFVAARAARRRAPPAGADARTRLASIDGILPLDAETWDDWVVWLCFWTEALFNPELARQQKEYSRDGRRAIEALLESLGCPVPLAFDLSQKVMTTLYGIAVQAAFDREYWTPAAQRAALHDVLKPALALIAEKATP